MLTAMRETFCQGLAEGLTQSEAYRRSHDASGMKLSTLHEEASRVANHPDVAARVEELKSQIVSKFISKGAWDLADLLDQYKKNAEGAREDHQWAASNGALSGYGKASGLVTDKLEVDITHTLKPGMSLEELESRVDRLNALEAGVIEGEAIVLDDDNDNAELGD